MESLDPTDTSSRWTGLKTRIISSVAMALPLLISLWLGGWLFMLFIVLAGLLMLREWDDLTAQEKPGWRIAGLLYIAIPCASLIWLREVRFASNDNAGMALVFFVILTVCATDIGAYFAGRRIGGPKLVPTISPNKTWAGLGGGIVSAAIVGAIASTFSPYPPSLIAALDLGIVIAIVAQLGDIFESWLKRRVNVKDSSGLIPGHGGLLDRVDGLIFTVPLFSWLVHFSGEVL